MQIPQISKRLALEIALGVIAAIAVASFLWNWYHPKVTTVTTTQYQPVPVEKKVETIRRVTVPGPERIVTIEKPVIVEKLKLPPEIANDPAKQVVANGQVTTHSGDTVSTVAVMDTNTGVTNIVAKEQPLSLFGFPNNIEAGVRYGLSTKDGQQGNVNARWQFLRIGNMYLGAYSEISTLPEAKAMLDLSYRF